MKPPANANEPERALFFRGRLIKVPFLVRTWVQHGMQFRGRFRSDTSLIVSHWTAAENPPHAVFQNLRDHKTRVDYKDPVTGEAKSKMVPEPLSVHFVIDDEGRIYQFADTELRCSHTGTEANGYSIGIEHICRGSNFKVLSKNTERRRVTKAVHGRQITFDALTEAQMAASVALNEALCDMYGLPFQVPMTSTGRILHTELPALTAGRFKGCVEHMNLKMTKDDCAGIVLEAIKKRADARGVA